MEPIEVLPDCEIEERGPVSREFRSRGVGSLHEACRWVRDLPYAYNSSHEDSLIIFRENCGVCYTKHGAIARLAAEHGLDIRKCMGVYRLNGEVISGIDAVIAPFGLEYIPQFHCFLECDGHQVDLTEGNCNGKNKVIDHYDFIVPTEADLTDDEKERLYLEYLEKYRGLEPKLAALAAEETLELLAEVNRVSQSKCPLRTDIGPG